MTDPRLNLLLHRTATPPDEQRSMSLSALRFSATAILLLGGEIQATSVWIKNISTLAFAPLESTLTSEHAAQISAIANFVRSQCLTFPSGSILAISAIVADEISSGEARAATERLNRVKQELISTGIAGGQVYEATYTRSQYLRQWLAAPSRAAASDNSVEVELACRPK